jgi:hypothetical protein
MMALVCKARIIPYFVALQSTKRSLSQSIPVSLRVTTNCKFLQKALTKWDIENWASAL